STFNIGTTTVTLTATNDCGSVTCTFDVIVIDNEAPVLTAANDQDVTLGANCTIIIPDVRGTATDNCGVTITQDVEIGSEVSAADGDEIPVIVTATDAAGNSVTSTVVLTAQDLSAPVLTAADDQDVTSSEELRVG